MAQEIELKLAFPPTARAAILRHPLLAQAERVGRAQTLINTYYDTPEMALSAKRIALRTRRIGKTWLQTVKCAADSLGGLSSRPEWEQPFKGRFDFSAVDAEQPRVLLEKHADTIVPLFTTNFRRDTLILAPRPGVRVLVMIDSGEISAGTRVETISELELELESGNVDDLFALACELATNLPLLAYDDSKAARGYRLFRQQELTPQRPAKTRMPPHAEPLAVFRQAAFLAISAWAANQHGAHTSGNPEFIHQLRLSLRQLRNLIRLFAPLLPAGFVSDWQSALQQESAALGEIRDLDVLLDETLVAASEGDSDQRLPPLLQHATACRLHAREALQKRLIQAGAGAALLKLNRALHALPAATQTTKPRDLARRSLKQHSKHAQQDLQALITTPNAETLHALRITLKRLRHARDFFAPLHDNKPYKRHTRALARLQADLGVLHDLALAMPRLTDWANSRADLREAVAFVSGWHAATSLKLRCRILPRCKQLLKKNS